MSDDEQPVAKDYEVERICGERTVKGETFYLVKWLDCPDTDNTWEPASNFLAGLEELLNKYRDENKRVTRGSSRELTQEEEPALAPTRRRSRRLSNATAEDREESPPAPVRRRSTRGRNATPAPSTKKRKPSDLPQAPPTTGRKTRRASTLTKATPGKKAKVAASEKEEVPKSTRKVSGARRRRSQLQMLEEDAVKIGSPKKPRRSEPEPVEEEQETVESEDEEMESTQERVEEPVQEEPVQEEPVQEEPVQEEPVQQEPEPVQEEQAPASPVPSSPPQRSTSRFFRQPGETTTNYMARLRDEGIRRRKGLPPAPVPVYSHPTPASTPAPVAAAPRTQQAAPVSSVHSSPADRGEVDIKPHAAAIRLQATQGTHLEHALVVVFYQFIIFVACCLSVLASSENACKVANTSLTALAASFPIFAEVQIECSAMNPGGWLLLNTGIFALGSSVVANMYQELEDRTKAMVLSQRFCHVVFTLTCCTFILLSYGSQTISGKDLTSAVFLIVFAFTMADVTLFHPFASTFANLKAVVTWLAVGAGLVSIHSPAFIPDQLNAAFFLGEENQYADHLFHGLFAMMAIQFVCQLSEFARHASLEQEEIGMYVLCRLLGVASLVIFPYFAFKKALFPALVVTTVMVTDFFLMVVDQYTSHTARINAE